MRNRVNDFALKLANVNGTGSASANGLLMQAIFRMGIPVSGKNLFPSNIQGLPTWYEIRVNKNGYTARSLDYDLMVAMNSQTYARDIQEVREGGYLLYDSSWPLDPALLRDDVHFLGVPFAQLCNDNFRDPRERILMKNIAYAGTLVAALQVDMEIVAALLEEKYAGKKKLSESNTRALRLGYDYARDHFDCPLPFHLEKMDANGDKILIDGNTAIALGCVYAGATVAAWYPITPSTSAMDAFKVFCEKYRKDPETGKNNYIIIQAEDELAAIGMVIGAAWSGARAFTSTAGPGISLMNELLGLAYYAEIPAVIIDVERVGPVHRHAHAHPAGRSARMRLRVARRHQTYSAVSVESGRVLRIRARGVRSGRTFSDAGLPDVRSRHRHERLGGPAPQMGRRLSARSRPRPESGGNRKAAQVPALHRRRRKPGRAAHACPACIPKASYFTRGSGHNKFGGYTEIPDEYQEVMDRLLKKHKAAAKFVPAPIIHRRPDAIFGVVTLGGCDPAVREALDLLAERGVVGRFHARPRLPLRCRRGSRSSPNTISTSSSSRIATPSSALC